MLKIGTTLILSEVELKHYKKLILSKYPCKEEVAYRKKIEEQKKIIEDQGHELYNQNKTIEFLKSELDKKKEPVKTSTIKIDDAAKFTTTDMHLTREEVCDMINKSLEESKEARSRKYDEAVLLPIARANYQPLTSKYNDLKAENEMLKKVAGNNTAKEIVIDQDTELTKQRIQEEDICPALHKVNHTIVLNQQQLDLAGTFGKDSLKDQVKRDIITSQQLRDLKNEALEYRAKYSNMESKFNDLKKAYNNLFEERTALDEKINDARIIIDALQKENDDLKAKLSDREAHACPSVNDKEYVDLLEAYRELKGKYEEAVKDATLSMAEKQQLVDQTQHLRNDIDKHRINANKYRNDAIKMASMILKIDTLSEEARKYLVIEGKKYQVSNKVYNNICSFISIARKIASRYKDYVDMEKYKEYIEFEFDDDNGEE